MSAAADWTPIENRVTGDRMLVLYRGSDAQGNVLEVQFDLPPHAAGSPMHRHRTLEERVDVLDGALRMCVDGAWRTVVAGESVLVRPGQSHCLLNESGAWVSFIAEIRPSGNFERFLRTWHGLANAGQASADGVPRNLLHLARCLQDADFVFSAAPAALQRMVIAMLVRVGTWVDAYATLMDFDVAPRPARVGGAR